MVAEVQLSVLGPLTAQHREHTAALGGRRQRMVLAALLAARGRVLPTDRLQRLVWDGERPASRATLHGYIAELRRALEPGRVPRAANGVLVREGPGYAVRLPPEQLDAEQFSLLVAQGGELMRQHRPGHALPLLERGLALWRGPAYADLAQMPFVLPEIARLDGMRSSATELRLTALLDLGRHAAILGDLEALVLEHPLRERGWELLAIALYRCGRQADALATIRRARATLADEIGLDPGPGLIGLETAILDHDDALEPPVRRDAQAATRLTPRPPRTTNLPAAFSSFLGRAAELGAVDAALAGNRLVTITGPGGIGKTRLALEVARRRADQDGPWLVELVGLRDPALVAGAVADAVGMPAATVAELTAVLAGRRMLVVVDNAEHVLGGVVDTVTALLSGCPRLQVMVTSRESLNLSGEHVVAVPPLPVADAVALLKERAAALGPMSEQDGVAAERICRELDGIPLAIELAAAQCRALSLSEVAFQLDDRFRLLDAGPHASSGRHRSLDSAIGWSYELLSTGERRLFHRLSVFDGGFDLDAARVIDADADSTVALIGLVRKSLVAVDTTVTPRRFRLLETIREYASRMLAGEERDSAVRLHRAWLLNLVELGAGRLSTADGGAWLRRFTAERDNIRAALSSAFDAGEPGTALRVCGALGWFWFRTGQIDEGLRWSRRTLAAVSPLDLPEPEVQLARVRTLITVGSLYYLKGQLEQATGPMTEAVRVAREIGSYDALSDSVIYMAYLLALSGHSAAAIAPADEGVRLAEALGTPYAQAESLMVRGHISRVCGDLPRARAELAKAYRLARQSGHSWAAISAGWLGSKVSMDLDEPEVAIDALREIVMLADPRYELTSILVSLHTLAGALAHAGRADTGAVLLGFVEAWGEPVGYFPARMDPVDAPAHAEAVRTGLSASELASALARGRAMTLAELQELVPTC
ncbi:BTAD domain-containing putative transcriptional regulator [Micromonospora sp. NPDC092111]|uniref:BTAD domain-containing putative transcriptional regulator n=1 Tax=Micromonospora sp. NPDC092111 TaxID=3364289 RepID=UPI00380BF442